MTVAIAARALLYDKRAETGLVASVYRQYPKRGAVFVKEVSVPIVDYVTEHAPRMPELDDLKSGRYLLQLALPDGGVRTQDFRVSKSRDTELLIDLPHEGPHEWSALHALTGRFRRRGGWIRPLNQQITDAFSRDYASLRQRPETGFQLRFVNTDSEALTSSLLADNDLPGLAKLLDADSTVEEAEDAVGTGIEILTPVEEAGDFALFELVYDGSLADGAQRADYGFVPGSQVGRVYLLQKSARGATLICLPCPWATPKGEVEIQLLWNKFSLGGEPDYSLTVGDPMINNTLGYINNGALHRATRMIDFEAAQQMLFEKVSYPLAAAIGGYLLILGLDRQAYEAKSERWKDWIGNLGNWFEWLPDGAILQSALYFVLGDKDRGTAYRAILTAYDRGLPYFTFGLKLMLEGMRRFAHEGDNEAAKRLKVLEAIAAAADPTTSFLSIELSRRWESDQVASQREPAHV